MKDTTLKQAKKLLEFFDDTPSDQVQDLLESGLLTDLRDANLAGIDRDAFRRLIGLKPINAFAVTVNCDLSVEDAIKAGKYDWANGDITGKHFPSTRTGTADTEIVLVHCNRVTESREVLRELDKQGLRPAELPELLALGARYPELQREFPIVALGSVWRNPSGYRLVPYLYGYASWRNLSLHWWGLGCSSHARFAAVRK